MTFLNGKDEKVLSPLPLLKRVSWDPDSCECPAQLSDLYQANTTLH
jgi:hypothetical protein